MQKTIPSTNRQLPEPSATLVAFFIFVTLGAACDITFFASATVTGAAPPAVFFSGLQMGTPYTVYVYAQNSSGDKSATGSINVETGCSFPGGHCIVLQSEEETRSNSDSHGNDLPLQPYNTQWKPIAWMRTYLTQKSKLGILHRFEGGSSRYEQL